ncbi:MAG: hypothetical protein HZY76_01425 [Anaerolineae bacterium]|nr:MAG: hypothetical protein HZY76_01425 [Anaerolineae bacterium]
MLDSPSGIDPFTPVLGYFGAILAALLIHFVANGLAALALTAHNVASLQQRPLRVGQGCALPGVASGSSSVCPSYAGWPHWSSPR